MAKQQKNDTNLHAAEVEAIRIGLKALPDIVRNQVLVATSSKSESQRRQSAELLLKYIMADRQQQLEVSGQINPNGGAVTQNISLTKIDARLVNLFDKIPPELQQRFADVAAEIESVLAGQDITPFEGEIIEVEMGPTCKCGCGTHVKKYATGPKKGKYATWAQGHHMRAGTSLPAIVEARKLTPKQHAEARRQRELADA